MLRGFLMAIILVALAYALSFALWVSLLPPTPDVAPEATQVRGKPPCSEDGFDELVDGMR